MEQIKYAARLIKTALVPKSAIMCEYSSNANRLASASKLPNAAHSLADDRVLCRHWAVIFARLHRLLYWCDFRENEHAGLYVFSLKDETKSRLLPNMQIRPTALAVDFAGTIIIVLYIASLASRVVKLSNIG